MIGDNFNTSSSSSSSWTEWWDPPNPATRAGEARVKQYVGWINGLGAVYLETASDITKPELLKELIEYLVPDCVLPREDHTCHAPRRCKDGTILDDESSLLEDCMMVVWEKGGAPPRHATEDLYSISDIQRARPPAIATLLHGLFKTFVLSEVVPKLFDMILWYNKVLSPYYKELSKVAKLLTTSNEVTCTELIDTLFDEFYDCSVWLCAFHSHCQPAYVLDVCTVYWKADSGKPTELLANAGFTFSLFEQYGIVPLYSLREYIKSPHAEFVILQAFVIWQVLQSYTCLSEVNLRALTFLDQSSLFRAARIAEDKKAKQKQREHEIAVEHQKTQLVRCESPHRSTYLGVLRQQASLDKEECDLKYQPPPVGSFQSVSPRQSTTPEDNQSLNKITKNSISENVTKMLQVMVNERQNELLQLPISDRSRKIVNSIQSDATKKRRSVSKPRKISSPPTTSVQTITQGRQPRWRGPSAKMMNSNEITRLELLKKSRAIPKLSRTSSTPTPTPRSKSGVNREQVKRERNRLQGRQPTQKNQKPAHRPIPKLRTSPIPPETPQRTEVSPPSWKDQNDISEVLNKMITYDRSPAHRSNLFNESSPGGGIFSPFAQDSIINTKQLSASPRSVSVTSTATREARSVTPHLVSATVQPANVDMYAGNSVVRTSGSYENIYPTNTTTATVTSPASDIYNSSGYNNPLQAKQNPSSFGQQQPLNSQLSAPGSGGEEIMLSSTEYGQQQHQRQQQQHQQQQQQHYEPAALPEPYIDSPRGLPLSSLIQPASGFDKSEYQQDKRVSVLNPRSESPSSAQLESTQQLGKSGTPSEVTTVPGINCQPLPSNSSFSVSAWSGSPLNLASVKTQNLENSKHSYFSTPITEGPILAATADSSFPREVPSWQLSDQQLEGVLVADLESVRRKVCLDYSLLCKGN